MWLMLSTWISKDGAMNEVRNLIQNAYDILRNARCCRSRALNLNGNPPTAASRAVHPAHPARPAASRAATAPADGRPRLRPAPTEHRGGDGKLPERQVRAPRVDSGGDTARTPPSAASTTGPEEPVNHGREGRRPPPPSGLARARSCRAEAHGRRCGPERSVMAETDRGGCLRAVRAPRPPGHDGNLFIQ